MKLSALAFVLLAVCLLSVPVPAMAKDGQLSLEKSGTNLFVQIKGSSNDD